ncbi:DUF177 domain-containing protein [Mucilaginibacter terrenus]|uniref:DUF177 domain-containing protein n=1 Tax=Mucilaginibacter terrenus TaxID=2482727 RepID=A0A3E2NPF4_9SPHI|nr:DUF177 domain-containing protein [Mucilaginibacter terrenus]RFZ82868.1 DUF177 domain-containing protein [Mucilaginibacter terrenus]
MKSLKTYAIPFTGLKLGKHVFEYDVKDDFFQEFEYSLVKKADLKCVVELEKQETMIILDFDIEGTIGVTCDKCLSDFPQPLKVQEQQIARFSDEEVAEDDEIITLGKNDHEINVASLIYEYVTVAVPFINTCGDEGNTPYCDKDMLDKLAKLSANDEQTEQADPRWEALKNLNN